MPDTPSITLIKRFTWRGSLEEWSNKYHFTGTQPANAAAWKTLADALIAEEKKCYDANHSVVRAYGYEAGNEFSAYQYDLTVSPATPVPGSLTITGSSPLPGDAAVCARWWTGARNERGKKIYCWKYFHGARVATGVSDDVFPAQKTAIQTFAAKVIDGTLPGSFKYSGPQGAALQDPTVLAYVTTRTLKRRGKRKRPPTS